MIPSKEYPDYSEKKSKGLKRLGLRVRFSSVRIIRTTRSDSKIPVLIAYNLGLIVQASKEEIEVKYLQAKLQQLYIDARKAKVESHSLDRIIGYLIRNSSTPLTEVWSGWPTCGQNNFQTQTELYPDIRSLTVTLQDVRTALRKGVLAL